MSRAASFINTAIPRFPDDMKRENVDTQRSAVLLNIDAPHHTRLRKIISRGFTPRAIGQLRDELDERAQRIAESAAAHGSGDFVEQVSCELPLQAQADPAIPARRHRHRGIRTRVRPRRGHGHQATVG